MKRLIQIICIVAVALGTTQAFAQDVVSIKDLNTYTNLSVYDQDSLQAHPLAGVSVTYTAVVVSYPRSSGLATPTDTDTDGIIDDISRIHIFVTDTAAVTQGRDGMSIQIVESDYELLEGFTRGDVVTFVGRLTFFNATSQMTVDETPTLLGNVNSEFPQYAGLLDPWEVTADEINTLNADGTHEINIANYGKYNGAYVKINNATVSSVSLGDRPDWAISNNGSRIYIYDTSLRYRNDRVAYLPSFNYRRAEDGDFVPPAPGSIVNISGFINTTGDDPDGNVAADRVAFGINPMEDGVVWLNGVRFEDGDDIGGGTILSWPNDLELVGSPPVFSEVSQSDSTVTSTDAVTVSATIVGVDAATITSAQLIYSGGGVTDTLAMTAVGDVYSATLPTFANFTAVSFYIEATDSEALVGRAPIAGNYGFFVQDGPINSISLIQQTSDDGAGASPLLGAGNVPTSITGLIVSDNTDGVIIVQDAAAAWSGVFLEITSATQDLNRGDEITITAAEVHEASVASNSLTLTQLVDIEFTVNSTGNDIETVIPVLTTDYVVANEADGELEPYEGMLVKFEDVEVVERGVFGEYIFQNLDADSADGAVFNEDIRSDAEIGTVGVSYDINHSIRMDVTMDAYGIVAASFGSPKFHPRDVNDFLTEDGNAFTPVLDFPLTSPADSVEIVVTEDVDFTWAATEDFDGDDVTYELVMYLLDSEADTVIDVVGIFPSANDSQDPMVTLVADSINNFLGEELELEVGESADFLWNVRVSDGSDTLDVHGPYGNFGDDFEPIYRFITFERGVSVNNEDEVGTPREFSLDQNYPNPFNPSTNINFSLPQTSKVTLNVYDMLGRKVATLLNNEQLNAANHTVKFDASALASGMYIYRIEAGSFTSTRKMMLIK
ncbi:MAG: T9SS type A sorting domain-containing protein [Balneolaceae bacterium]